MKPRRSLAVMARTPELRRTKTRLIPALGETGAMQAHIVLVEDTLARLRDLAVADASLWVTDVSGTARGWAATFGLPLHIQPGGDLGEKMHGIISNLLASGANQVCLIGTDCPGIDAGYIEKAFSALADSDVVIGPAEDGGYGLIGLRDAHAQLFAAVDWGTARVLRQTLARVEAAGLEARVLQPVWDVDTPRDWHRYQSGSLR